MTMPNLSEGPRSSHRILLQHMARESLDMLNSYCRAHARLQVIKIENRRVLLSVENRRVLSVENRRVLSVDLC